MSASAQRTGVLGPAYSGTLWFGSARWLGQAGGTGGNRYCLRLPLARDNLDLSANPRLADKVADNLLRAQKFDGKKSETLVIGRCFGVTAAIEQGQDGNLYVVSLSDNRIYRISAAAP
ncbi:MAG: hypothetical protein Q8M64_04200 [Methyloversatilis sp.]|nr:hypothetical protein [Methyloversatilis sp.]